MAADPTPLPDPPPGPPPRFTRLFRQGLEAIAFVVLVAGLATLGAAAWLATTESGLNAACALARSLSGGRLLLVPAGGRLAGPLHLQEAVWREPGLTVRISDLTLDWLPNLLVSHRLQLARLSAAAVHIDLADTHAGPPPLPASLRLPLTAGSGEIRIGRLEMGQQVVAEALSGRIESDGATHHLADLKARTGPVSLTGDLEVQADAPFGLSARVTAKGELEGKPFTLAVDATGELSAIEVSGQGSGAMQGKLSGLITPFAPQLFRSLQIHVQGIDPAAWVPGAPQARLDVDADILPRHGKEWAVGGRFAVANRAPGRLDGRRLPVTGLSGRADWQGGTATFDELEATLAGGGRLTGRGRYRAGEVHLDLTAHEVNAAGLHPRLRPTRLSGPLALALSRESQSLTAALADPRFRIAAQARRQGERLDISRLHLTAGAAELDASGRLGLDAAYRFEARGELRRFDPSRFAKVPAGRINGKFDAAGRLQPQLALALDFDLQDSRFDNRPLTGRGKVDLAWPQVREANVELAAGANRLTARGAFGRPGDRLDFAIDAPDLAPYGLEGGLQGRFFLTGTPAAPAISGELQAPRLGHPDLGRIAGLALQGEVGPRDTDPVRISLKLAALDLPSRPGAARDVAIRVEGSRARHRLEATARLAGRRELDLQATGGLSAKVLAWRGEIEKLALTAVETRSGIEFSHPAPLQLAAHEWSLGPAEIAAAGWRGRLEARAAQGRLKAEAHGRGERLGDIDARLEAQLQGAWHLAAAAPWQGRLELAGADIAWLGPWLGDDWRTAGRLEGELHLAGTPSHPLVTGQVAGEKLGLRILSQGLDFDNGRLVAELSDNRLRVTPLAFDSRLREPPRALVRAAGNPVAELAATPGRLEVRGEIGFGDLGGLAGSEGGESGYLDLRLDRVGIFQQADQWVALSGGGRLRWQGAALEADGKLTVDAGYWRYAQSGMPRLSEDVVVRPSRGGKPAPAARPKLDIDIETDLGPRFYFVGAGLETRLAGSVRLQAAGRDLPRATGTIQSVDGKFDAYGQKLAVERGIVNFQGFLDNPRLNVRAVRHGLPVEPGVEVTGPLQKPVVRLVSEPDLPEAEKLSWLVLGHGPEQVGGSDASTLASAASALLGKDGSGGVMQQLQRRFGLEEFGLRQGRIGDTTPQPTSRVASSGGFSGTTTTPGSQIVTVSKRLAANALLSYEQTLGKTENIVKLTVNLTRRLAVIGRAGSDNAVDLLYTFSFGK